MAIKKLNDTDTTGNYVTHQVPKELFYALKSMFSNYIFNRIGKDGEYLIRTHIGQRNLIKKHLNIELP